MTDRPALATSPKPMTPWDEDTRALLEKIEVVYSFCMQRRHMRYVDLEGYQPGPHTAPENRPT